MHVVQLPEPEHSVTVEMALARAAEAGLKDVFICGYTEDGYFRTWSAKMSNANAYFALAQAQHDIMSG